MNLDKRPNSRIRLRRSAREPVPALKSISAEKLFGKYTFKEFQVYGQDKEAKNLSLFYGENGVGKTTILKLIYATLVDETNTGLKKVLASTAFASFTLTFSDDQKIILKRPAPVAGKFEFILSGPRQNEVFKVNADEDHNIWVNENEGINEFLALVTAISPQVVFINDVRSIRSSNPSWNIRGLLDYQVRTDGSVRGFGVTSSGRPTAPDPEMLAKVGLERLMQEAHQYIRDRAIRSNAAANAGTGQIYASIARTLSRTSAKAEAITPDDVSKLIDRIREAQKYIDQFGEYSLLQGEHLNDISRYLSAASKDASLQIYEVIEPYIISIEKRIEKNKPIAEQTYLFENSINSFLKRKVMSFKVSSLPSFKDEEGNPLEVESLSSGERHLLYMLGISMLSRYEQTLVLIDEPELSLNYKWQRQLVDAMLDVSSEERSQFIMATHSFEVISSHRDATVELEPSA